MNHSIVDKASGSNRIVKFGVVILLLSLGSLAALAFAGQIGESVNLSGQIIGVDISRFDHILTTFFPLVGQWPLFEVLSASALVILAGLLVKLYLGHARPLRLEQPRHLGIVSLFILLFIGLAWMIVPNSRFLYLLPTATLSIILAALTGLHFSMLVTVLVGLVVGYIAGGSLELAVYAMMGGLMGILSLKGQTAHVNRLWRAGVYVALANITVVLIFHLPEAGAEARELIRLMTMGITNGILAASLTLTGFFLLDNLLGITTSLRLLDLAQLTHPLLQELLKVALGTYDHTLKVSNLAEQAAERIGADTLLTQVGAYYHDIGKMTQPHFFVENQLDGNNDHDKLDPQTSARIIINHVKEGLKLARKYRLPREVQAFIAEHHGTTLVQYFYHRACKQASAPADVNEAKFRYPGPKPQRKETAIVMLADSCESAARAARPATPEAFDQLVRQIIKDKLEDGQLSECDLTIHDLELIRQTFVEIFHGTLHHRLEYPAEKKQNETP
jgi:putative nucleotidyltransferase with HDIG domain